MTQEAFGRHHNQGQRVCHEQQGLTPQKVKILGSRSRIGDAHVDLSRHLQKAFETTGRVIRALSLIAVGQEQHQRWRLIPLGKAGEDKLIDDRLGDVDKIAILGLPEYQPFRALNVIAIFKADSGGFAQGAVVNFKGGFGLGQVVQGCIGRAAFGIRENGMAMTKGATLDIFAGDTNGCALRQDGSKGQLLGNRPVNGGFVIRFQSSLSPATDALQAWVNIEAFRHLEERIV